MKWSCNVITCPLGPGVEPGVNFAGKRVKAALYLSSAGDRKMLSVVKGTAAKSASYRITARGLKVWRSRLRDGKITLEITEAPAPVRLLISSEPALLEDFCAALERFLECENSRGKPSFVTREPPSRLAESKVSDGRSYSSATEVVKAVDANIRRLDVKLCSLMRLRSLNLTKNFLTELPKQLGEMPNLTELILADNRLGTSTREWEWLRGERISKVLRSLDLRKNSVTLWPSALSGLSRLVSLDLSDNSIKFIPSNVRRMESLQYFKISKNELNVLPAPLRRLNLLELDISSNPMKGFSGEASVVVPKVRSLVDLASAVILERKIRYGVRTLPRELARRLDDFGRCVCGKPSGTSSFRFVRTHYASVCRHAIIRDETQDSHFTMFCRFCSERCAKIYG